MLVFCTYSEVILLSDFTLPGPLCDEPAEGKRKGRPKVDAQELRNIPVSPLLNLGLLEFFACRQLLLKMENMHYSGHFPYIKNSLLRFCTGPFNSTMEGRVSASLQG